MKDRPDFFSGCAVVIFLASLSLALAADINIFKVNLAAGWNIKNSNGLMVRKEQCDNAPCLHIMLKGNGEHEFFSLVRNSGLNLSKFNHNGALVFEIRPDAGAANVDLRADLRGNRLSVANYIDGPSLLDEGWHKAEIPLADFFLNESRRCQKITDFNQISFYFHFSFKERARPSGFKIRDLRIIDCEKSKGIQVKVLDDFENGAGLWSAYLHDETATMLIEDTGEEAKAGRRSALVMMRGKGTIGMPLDGSKASEEGYDRITFWVKQGPLKKEKCFAAFTVQQEGKTYYCAKAFAIPADWEKITMRFAQGNPSPSSLGAKMDPSNIINFYFSSWNDDACFYLDQVQLEGEEP